LESIAEGDGDGSSPQAVATPMEILTRGKSKLDKVSRWLDEQPESSGLEEQDGEQPLVSALLCTGGDVSIVCHAWRRV
jgi:hypothetical protein